MDAILVRSSVRATFPLAGAAPAGHPFGLTYRVLFDFTQTPSSPGRESLGSACAGQIGKELRGCVRIRLPSLLLTVQPPFLFPGSVSCRGALVPGFPGGPNTRRGAAQRVASNAVGPLGLSHPLPVLTHPSLPTVGNPSSHLFPTRNPPPPKRANSNRVGTCCCPEPGPLDGAGAQAVPGRSGSRCR